MPQKYTIQIPYTGFTYVEVIADSEAEAIELAKTRVEDEGPDTDDVEVDYTEAELAEKPTDPTPDELAQWLAAGGNKEPE